MARHARRFAATLALLLLPSAAAANPCMSLWVEHDGCFDARGYCFTGPLGQGDFDSADCTTRSIPTLPPDQARRVAEITAREAQLD